MNLLQFGNVLIDLGDVVFVTRNNDETQLKLRGGHELSIDGDIGKAVWTRLSGRLIDQMPKAEQAT